MLFCSQHIPLPAIDFLSDTQLPEDGTPKPDPQPPEGRTSKPEPQPPEGGTPMSKQLLPEGGTSKVQPPESGTPTPADPQTPEGPPRLLIHSRQRAGLLVGSV